jgi:hypothetical protein
MGSGRAVAFPETGPCGGIWEFSPRFPVKLPLRSFGRRSAPLLRAAYS